MSAASNYLENVIIEAVLRGGAWPSITKGYVALHTADPAETGASEVTLAAWPAYARQDAAKGGAIATGWTAASNGTTSNALQLLFPVFDGAGSLTVTHFSIWTAATGGNMLIGAPLTTQRTVQTGDVFVVDIGKLTVQCL